MALNRLPQIRTLDRRKLLRELIPVWKQTGDVQRMVAMVFDYHRSDIDALQQVLFEQARRDYGIAIAAEARAAGYEVANVRVLDRRVLTELNQRSRFAAESIAATHNRDLRGQIGRIAAETPKANRWVYASRLEQWEKSRVAWKSSQIATTELGETMQRAKTDFATANAVGAKARVMPLTAACPACAEMVGHGWMDLSEAMMYPLPLHVGCVHYLEIEYGRAGMPPLEELWLAGMAVAEVAEG